MKDVRGFRIEKYINAVNNQNLKKYSITSYSIDSHLSDFNQRNILG